MDQVISVLTWPVSGLILISVVITVHELGHYWVGRIFNAAAESFSVGFGRPILQVTDKRGTRWRVNWLPLGGFVKFVGEIQAPTDTHEVVQGPVGKPYTELGPLKRFAVSLGGPLANFIFAVAVFAGMAMALGVPQAKEVSVTEVIPGSAAAAAGFKVGDVVLEAGGHAVGTNVDITRATELSAGEPVRYRVMRAGAPVDLVATPIETQEFDETLKVSQKVGRIGLKLDQRNTAITRLNPVEAVGYGVSATGDAIGATLNVLRRLVTGRDGLDKLSGPLGIFSLADNVTDHHMKQEGASYGARMLENTISLIQLAALLSIGVGFFNLLPIPVLDGGAAVMCIAEAVTGREVPEKVQRVGLTIGLACIVSFALVITWQDIIRLWPGGP